MKKEELLQEIEKRIAESERRTALLMRKITEEILVVQAEVRELKKIMSSQMELHNILPVQPFETMQDFKSFEGDLKINEEKFKHLEKEFFLASDKSTKDFLRRNWRRVFNDTVASQFAWTGTATKAILRSTLTATALKNAFRKRFKDSSYQEYEQISMKHIQTAADRIKKNNIYKSKQNSMEGDEIEKNLSIENKKNKENEKEKEKKNNNYINNQNATDEDEIEENRDKEKDKENKENEERKSKKESRKRKFGENGKKENHQKKQKQN